MARTQSKTSTNVTAATPAPVAAPVAETKPAATPKATKTTAATKKVETPTPVVAAPVVVVSAVEATSTETSSRDDRHKAALKSIDDQVAALKALRATLVANFKADSADLKAAQKSGGRRRRAAPVSDEAKAKRAPSGITKPTQVSEAMCEFMGKPKGSLIARTEVTKFITNYIKEHNLKDQTVKRHINPDASLRKLLNVPQSEQLTYFNLQKYMTSHFPAKATASA